MLRSVETRGLVCRTLAVSRLDVNLFPQNLLRSFLRPMLLQWRTATRRCRVHVLLDERLAPACYHGWLFWIDVECWSVSSAFCSSEKVPWSSPTFAWYLCCHKHLLCKSCCEKKCAWQRNGRGTVACQVNHVCAYLWPTTPKDGCRRANCLNSFRWFLSQMIQQHCVLPQLQDFRIIIVVFVPLAGTC
jgi:hypothetical protein